MSVQTSIGIITGIRRHPVVCIGTIELWHGLNPNILSAHSQAQDKCKAKPIGEK